MERNLQIEEKHANSYNANPILNLRRKLGIFRKKEGLILIWKKKIETTFLSAISEEGKHT